MLHRDVTGAIAITKWTLNFVRKADPPWMAFTIEQEPSVLGEIPGSLPHAIQLNMIDHTRDLMCDRIR